MEQLTQTILGLPLPMVLFLIITGAGRAMGALFGLWGLYFVLGTAATLRMVLALVISAPMIAFYADTFVELAQETQTIALLVIPVREFVLGVALGFLASLPFFAILGAAMLIDQYRGDFNPANQGPEGQMIGSFSTLKVAMALFLFVEVGGFLLVVTALYQSYAAFPPGVGSLGVAPDFADRIGDILQSVFVTLILVALPVVVALLLIDVAVSLAVRVAGQIKLQAVDFLLKNLLLTLAMPIMVFGMVRAIEMAFNRYPNPLGLLQGLLGP